jgi:biopolymer transport protein ExbD
MAKKKKKVPQLNSTSSADIAFIMLLFFLLTSSMDTDRGLPRRLPPPIPKDEKKDESVDIKKRNLLIVLINTNNQILCGEDYVPVDQLKDRVKEFVLNTSNNEHLPEKVEVEVPYFGNLLVTKHHIISLQNDRGTTYQVYIDVQNEIAAAYTELRDDISQQKFGLKYVELDEDQQSAVQTIYPQKISEAEPKNYGKVK